MLTHQYHGDNDTTRTTHLKLRKKIHSVLAAAGNTERRYDSSSISPARSTQNAKGNEHNSPRSNAFDTTCLEKRNLRPPYNFRPAEATTNKRSERPTAPPMSPEPRPILTKPPNKVKDFPSCYDRHREKKREFRPGEHFDSMAAKLQPSVLAERPITSVFEVDRMPHPPRRRRRSRCHDRGSRWSVGSDWWLVPHGSTHLEDARSAQTEFGANVTALFKL